jgi:hypothetical protein
MAASPHALLVSMRVPKDPSSGVTPVGSVPAHRVEPVAVGHAHAGCVQNHGDVTGARAAEQATQFDPRAPFHHDSSGVKQFLLRVSFTRTTFVNLPIHGASHGRASETQSNDPSASAWAA